LTDYNSDETSACKLDSFYCFIKLEIIKFRWGRLSVVAPTTFLAVRQSLPPLPLWSRRQCISSICSILQPERQSCIWQCNHVGV